MNRRAFADKTVSIRSVVEDWLERHGCLLCNCAECGAELLSIRSKIATSAASGIDKVKKHLPPPVYGKINNRPYCRKCLNCQ